MNVIIEDEGSSVNNITATINFPKLHELLLSSLEELKSFYSGEIVCDSMRTITIWGCKELRRLPIRFLVNAQQQQPLITPSVLNIVAHQEWWDSVELDNPQAKTVLQQTAQFDWRR
uniref:Uncharacterized protein n=1 Tax=Davidia involucrata TaxID=16924 RepID=A0A5B6YLM5_DAVIN